MSLADLRRDYSLAGLLEKDLARDPFRQFEKWFQEAEAAKVIGLTVKCRTLKASPTAPAPKAPKKDKVIPNPPRQRRLNIGAKGNALEPSSPSTDRALKGRNSRAPSAVKSPFDSWPCLAQPDKRNFWSI